MSDDGPGNKAEQRAEIPAIRPAAVNPSGLNRLGEGRPVCPVCGGPLIEIRMKLQCARCHTICETCCEGGRTDE